MRTQSLDLLINLTRDARDAASKLLASELRDQQFISRQLEQLAGYRQEYRDRLHAIATQGIELTTLREFQRFLGTLDSAIQQAQERLARQEQQVLKRRELWQHQQRRLTGFDTIAARLEATLQQQEKRREQRQQDEISAGLSARKIHFSDTVDPNFQE